MADDDVLAEFGITVITNELNEVLILHHLTCSRRIVAYILSGSIDDVKVSDLTAVAHRHMLADAKRAGVIT